MSVDEAIPNGSEITHEQFKNGSEIVQEASNSSKTVQGRKFQRKL